MSRSIWWPWGGGAFLMSEVPLYASGPKGWVWQASSGGECAPWEPFSEALDSAMDTDYLFLVGNEDGLSMAHAKGEVRPSSSSTLEATQGQILSQSPLDATSGRYGS